MLENIIDSEDYDLKDYYELLDLYPNLMTTFDQNLVDSDNASDYYFNY